MRTIGLLGGMSWESSAEYYRIVNELVGEALGGLHSAPCILYSVDFATIEELQAAGEWDAAGALLAEAAAALERAGAQLIVLCTNTMHKVADRIEGAISVPFLHLADTTARAVLAQELVTVGLLGTAFTMEQDFYVGRLAEHGLMVLTPGAEDRALVHGVIYDQLCRGIVDDASRAEFRRIIADLVDGGAQGVVLGCTEIELLIGDSDASVPLFPTARLHAEAAARLALEPSQ